jgi:transcriptional regulator with GAF, ATPase, and Fis domain
MSGPDRLDELDQLAAGMARVRGDALFPAIVQCLAQTLEASHALISEIAEDGQAHTVAVFSDGAPRPNYPYPLSGAPCEHVLKGDTVHLPDAQGGQPAYFGVPLIGEDGRVLGHMCASATKALGVSSRQQTLCEILAARAAAELQRRAIEQQLEDLHRRQLLLEARNRHLEDELKLIEREQVAALAGGLHRTQDTRPAVDLDDNTATGLHHVQREHILKVLNATHWVIEGNSGAALKLGMKPATLRHRMKKLGISRDLRVREHEPPSVR